MKKELIKFENYDYEIIRMSLLNLQVCSNCPPEKMDLLEVSVKSFSPSGTTGNWQIVKDGDLAPVPCSNGGRWHYIFSC